MAEAIERLAGQTQPPQRDLEAERAAAERISVATQWQLMWWRFRKHRLAMVAAVVIALFYTVVLFADFFAYSDPHRSDAQLSLLSPQPIFWFDEGQFRPYVLGLTGKRDPKTFKRVYQPDPEKKMYLTLWAEGYPYKLFGLIPTNLHLLGVEGGKPEEALFLMGTDLQGRDLFSRLMLATRTSLTIGLVGVALSLFLGVLLGGISGLYGGPMDAAIQRVIEIVRSIPTIPLWMALAAAMPSQWPITRIYFFITIIIALIGWTTMARVVRGRFLALRQEDFVTAAELAGASQMRIIFRHMVPSFLSHIIAATTLALPAMIIAETSLSFLGLGLRAPAVSWGVLLQQASNIQSVALTPWLLIPAIPVILAVLAFNFLGDGLRDAADPYG
ncbi:MAG TPA: ABC transporter permease [Caldilineaceae bacterium]|nr:ABC transporter permease [Caldilineaceae bacterium]